MAMTPAYLQSPQSALHKPAAEDFSLQKILTYIINNSISSIICKQAFYIAFQFTVNKKRNTAPANAFASCNIPLLFMKFLHLRFFLFSQYRHYFFFNQKNAYDLYNAHGRCLINSGHKERSVRTSV